ncbi:MAG: hypothetical protein M3H12_04745 [Chromatiales bacterium]|nr:hypothetical protein [Gammaproteobacteria bacterium]
MARDENKQWRCLECSEIVLETELLTAKNPFDDTDTLVGCPKCRGVGGFEEICDETKCEEKATCGFPDKKDFGGYRRTCGKHYRQYSG